MVLLGVPDVDVSYKHKTSSQTNKIGGTPDWPDQKELASPKCVLCGECQSLVVQLYCPLEYSSYHRTLYVFACPNPPCWNMVKSWTVYRCQTLDKSTSQPPQQSTASSSDSASDWGMDADNWGDDANDWGSDTNDWGSDTNEWGSDSNDDAKDLSTDANNWDDNTKDLGDKTSGPGDDCEKVSSIIDGVEDCSLSPETSPASQYDESIQKQVSEAEDAAGDCCSGIEQMSINERTESPSSQQEGPSVIKENMPAVSDDEKSRILKSFNTAATGIGEHRTLKSYYINVFEEPDSQVEDKRHVTKLFKDYQKREGFNAEDFMETDSSRGGEKYERTVLIHKDVMFHKFMKRISLCPEQCIRYDWNGVPLYNCVPGVDVPSVCSHCNSETVFELQLTPALVNHLRFDVQVKESQSKGCVVEFGTVIIYTCKQNCWNDDNVFRTENKMVFADPDQHLFK